MLKSDTFFFITQTMKQPTESVERIRTLLEHKNKLYHIHLHLPYKYLRFIYYFLLSVSILLYDSGHTFGDNVLFKQGLVLHRTSP